MHDALVFWLEHLIDRNVAVSVNFSAAAERLETLADSTGRCNTFAEHFSRCSEAKRLAWPLVQLSGDHIELRL